MTEGQKAVLANEYRKILSEKAKKQRAEIANAVKYDKASLEDTVVSKINEQGGNILGETVSSKVSYPSAEASGPPAS